MTATLIPSVWIEDDEVVIHDRLDTSPGRVHVRVVQMAWHCANESDGARASVGGRSYHRDVLLAALDLVNAIPKCVPCGGAFGGNPVGDDNTPMCDGCCSSTQGSIHDDKTEF